MDKIELSHLNKLNFITFAEGKEFNKMAEQNKKRLLRAYPDSSVKIYNLNQINDDNKDYIKNNPRGLGYWIWKPQILVETINNLRDNSIVIYFDSRCAFFGNSITWLQDLVESNENHLENKELVIYQSQDHLEIEWSKKDLIEYLGLEESHNLLFDGQFFATLIAFRLTNETRRLINMWYDLSRNRPHLIDDSFSAMNYPEFKEHRHDQSILSLLIKSSFDLKRLRILNKEEISSINTIILHYFTHPKRNQSKMKNNLKLLLPFSVQMFLRSIRQIMFNKGFYK